MNILLINPPLSPPHRTGFPPTGLAYISASLKAAGYKVSNIDASNMTWENLEKNIALVKPDIVGLTCFTFARHRVFKTSHIARRLFPNIQIILGGQHATFLPEQTLEASNADFIVLREGEVTIVELVKCIQDEEDPLNVQGIVFKKNGQFIKTQPRAFIDDLNTIPFPDYTDFDLNDYTGMLGIDRKAAGITTSRGCPFDCNFCSSREFWSRKWRYRSAENVLNEIDHLYHNLGVRALMIFDDNFTVNRKRAIEVCKGIIDRKLDLAWISIASVRAVDKEVLEWMKKAGCVQVQYGVESGSERILKNINKQQSLEQIKQAFRWTKEVGLDARAYLFIGSPGETKETIDETVQMMKEIMPHHKPIGGILWVLPGTKVCELAKEKESFSDKFWIDDYQDRVYYTGENTLEELKELHMHLKKGLARNRGFFYFSFFVTKTFLRKFGIINRVYLFVKEKSTRSS